MSMTLAPTLAWDESPTLGSRPCMRDERSELSYEQVRARVDALAEQLVDKGVAHGDIVAIMLPNCVELLVGILAAWRLGAIATPINPAFTDNEARYQIEDSDAVLLIADREPTGYEIDTLPVEEMRLEPSGTQSPNAPGSDDIALLIYTSGSTGRPKGVMLDHGNLAAMATMLAEHLRLDPSDHCLLVLPLFHVNSLCASFLAPISAGAQITILSRFELSTFLAAVESHRLTYFSAVPTIYARLAELPDGIHRDTSSLRFAICGAAPVSRELLERCERRFGFVILEGYGLTEGTCASTCNPLDGPRKLGTVGPPLSGQEVAVVDAKRNHLPAGEIGEVVVRGPNLMRGYLNRSSATADALVEGWLHTGDIGILDDDGYLTIVDRIKDMIIRGGENVYPKEIEATLCRHSAVLEAAVVGQQHSIYGEVPVAFVVPYPDAVVTSEALLEHCRSYLTKIKLPVQISIVGELPKNPVGKIDKPTLRRSLSTAE